MEKFSKQIKADEDGYYMSCPEVVAGHIAEQLKSYDTAVELCCAIGMNVIQLAKVMRKVYGVDINNERIENAKYNAELYGVSDKTEFIAGSVIDEEVLKNIHADVAVLDPDWRGEITAENVFSIDDTQPSLRKMVELTKKYITKDIVLRIPKTFTFETLSELGNCKIENIIYEGRLRFKIAYFLDVIKENEEIDVCFDN